MSNRQLRYKIKKYDTKDPRYNLIVDDFNGYGRQIHPQNIILNCDKSRNNNYLCNLNISTPSDSLKRFKTFKKQNQNTIIDKTYLAKSRNPNILIDTSPDIIDDIKNYPNKYNKSQCNKKTIEGFRDNTNYLDTPNNIIYYFMIILFVYIYVYNYTERK
jgi:hypothetical protein